MRAVTNEFARALGFGSRSQLQNNGGGLAHGLQPTHTECVNMAWKGCEGLINSVPNRVFWRHWPYSKVHDSSGAGQGLDTLTSDAAEQLGSDDFWAFVGRLAIGRRLVITSATAMPPQTISRTRMVRLASSYKKTFTIGRSIAGTGDTGPFVLPVAM